MKTWSIETLELGHVELNRRRMIVNASGNGLVRVPVQGWLLQNGEHKVLIDTGFRSPEVLQKLGDSANGISTNSLRLELQLKRLGLEMKDIDFILHTHLHLDHAGQTDQFPMSTVVVVNRRELEYAVSGLSGPSYPAEDIKHLIDRLHTPGALQLLDLEQTPSEEILPGIVCSAAGGHTEGSMLIHVQSDQGMAVFSGDLVYSVFFQLLSKTVLHADPVVSANFVVSRRNEKSALKRLLQSHPEFTLYPSHDLPVKIKSGRVVHDSFKGDDCGPSGCWCSFVETMGYSEQAPQPKAKEQA